MRVRTKRRNSEPDFRESLAMPAAREESYVRASTLIWLSAITLFVLAVMFAFLLDLDVTRQTELFDLAPSL